MPMVRIVQRASKTRQQPPTFERLSKVLSLLDLLRGVGRSRTLVTLTLALSLKGEGTIESLPRFDCVTQSDQKIEQFVPRSGMG